jgi:predicted hydrolase (HD superfamily)
MSITIPTREMAFNLFKKYNKSESLLKHALSVETVNAIDVHKILL